MIQRYMYSCLLQRALENSMPVGSSRDKTVRPWIATKFERLHTDVSSTSLARKRVLVQSDCSFEVILDLWMIAIVMPKVLQHRATIADYCAKGPDEFRRSAMLGCD